MFRPYDLWMWLDSIVIVALITLVGEIVTYVIYPMLKRYWKQKKKKTKRKKRKAKRKAKKDKNETPILPQLQ